MSTSISPPYNVVYYNSNAEPVTGASGQCFNVVIYSFLSWYSASDVYLDGNLSQDVLGDITTLQSEGIKVLISLAGGDGDDWSLLVGETDTFASAVQAIVSEHGFDGVDVDFEDTQALFSGGSYDGIQLLIDLTNSLSAALDEGAILTHAPQPPYLCSPDFGCTTQPTPYVTILDSVCDKISWLNMQFYNNEGYEGESKVVEQYQEIVNGWTYTDSDGNSQTFAGLAPSQLVTGFPTSEDMAGSGYISADDVVSGVISPLQSLYDDYAGVMGWQFSGADSDWGTTIGAALGTCSSE